MYSGECDSRPSEKISKSIEKIRSVIDIHTELIQRLDSMDKDIKPSSSSIASMSVAAQALTGIGPRNSGLPSASFSTRDFGMSNLPVQKPRPSKAHMPTFGEDTYADEDHKHQRVVDVIAEVNRKIDNQTAMLNVMMTKIEDILRRVTLLEATTPKVISGHASTIEKYHSSSVPFS